jgi:hypothetical protein
MSGQSSDMFIITQDHKTATREHFSMPATVDG